MGGTILGKFALRPLGRPRGGTVAPKGAQETPRAAQETPRAPPKLPKWTSRGPQGSKNEAQESPKLTQIGPGDPQRAQKRTLRLQEFPPWSLNHENGPTDIQKSQKMEPKMPPGHRKCPPKLPNYSKQAPTNERTHTHIHTHTHTHTHTPKITTQQPSKQSNQIKRPGGMREAIK